MNNEIYQKMRDRLRRLEYPPGMILNEQVLAKEFGVSRTPMRTVLNRLEWEHFVRILPRTGTLVTEIELGQIMDVYEVRLELEKLIGRLAAENFTEKLHGRLENLRNECTALYDNKNRNVLGSIDQRIKDIFYEASGNPVLTEISERLYALSFRLWYFNMGKGEWHEEVAALEKELCELTRAVATPDPKVLGDMRRNQLINHLYRIKEKFLTFSS